MIYSDIRRLVLSHIDRYSLQGVALPLAYSLQSDDENRIPFFVNEGVLAAGGKTRLLPPDPRRATTRRGRNGCSMPPASTPPPRWCGETTRAPTLPCIGSSRGACPS